MVKHRINLLIRKEEETPLMKKLKKVLSLSAFFGVILFLISFFFSIFYINQNLAKFNLSKKEAEMLEKKIAEQKNLEGIYLLTSGRLNFLDKTVVSRKKFTKLLLEVEDLQGEGITIKGVSADKGGKISFSVIASSAARLNDFVSMLIVREEAKLFSDIKAQGIVRPKSGSYLLNISLTGSKELLQ